MAFIVGLLCVAVIFAVLTDAFESVLLPRRVTHGYRLIRLFYRASWSGWRRLAGLARSPRRRESVLSIFGPISLLGLFTMWAVALIIAFGLLHWSLGTRVTGPEPAQTPFSYVYFSGVTFFTLGYGDVTPTGTLGRLLAVVEAGLGFGFLAVIISYHPVLTQAFSHREITISLLDARGGSPPTASQILLRAWQSKHSDPMSNFMSEWEIWAAELLESCLSFPMLAYYRSQHDNQSWLAAVTAILDTCALQICGLCEEHQYQSRLTFAIARHAVVDLCLVFKIQPMPPAENRLTTDKLGELRGMLIAEGIEFPEVSDIEPRLTELRHMYEPFVNGLARYFLFKLPGIFPERLTADNWQTSAFMPKTPGIRDLSTLERGDHFD